MSKAIAMVALALGGVVGCSSAGSPSSINGSADAGSDDGSSVSGDAASHAEGGGGDASSSGDAGPLGDATSTDATQGDASADPLVPHPPAGSTMCGHGTFSEADFAMGCMAPSFALDDVPQPDGGFGPAPRSCNALTVGGGSWQVWCTATDAYIWARFDQLTNTGTLVDCHAASLIWIDEGVYDTGSGGGNGVHVGTYQNGSQIVGTIPGMPQTGIADLTVGNTATGGAAQLFLLGSLEDTCNMGASGPPTVYGGISVTWMGH